jgi:signal transduction histidine kinase/putative methionine-R-sulfoxide reductase with GAF domain
MGSRDAKEQVALRRVAELVARGTPQHELFSAVAAEASALIEEDTTLLRVEIDGTFSVVAASGGPAPIGTRLVVAPDDEGVVAQIARTSRPARLDDYATRPGPALARDDYGVGSSVGVPIVIDDAIWGILGATTSGRRLSTDTEDRLAQFAGLVAAALANAQARAQIQQLADEQAALRAVAELVAQTAPPEEIFTAVTAEASRLLSGTPMTLTRFGIDRDLLVLATYGGPAPVGTPIAYEPDTLPDRVRAGAIVRVDDYRLEPDSELATTFNFAAAVSVPISVAGRVWGMLTATSDSQPLPAGAEHRLMQFTGLVTAALANIATRTQLQALADEQAALRSVAELAAQGAPADEVLGAVAAQASRLAGVDFSTMLRYEPDGSTEIVALDGAPPGVQVGQRAGGDGDGSVQRVWRTRQPARVDNLADMSGHWPQVAHGHGFSTSAAVPILIQGTLWGALVVVGRDKPLPSEIHAHLSNFAELAGTAISAAQARRELRQLAEEQGALRRVAELVARGAALPAVFAAVASEASRLLGNLAAVLLRYDADGVAVAVAAWNSPVPLGLRMPAVPNSAVGEVLATGKPFRIDSYAATPFAERAAELGIAAAVAVPVAVEGRLWGTLSSSSPDLPLPESAEERLTPFAELAAAAIANAENRAKLTASRARVVATADETRRRLQRDVHDSAQQRLVHTIITLKLARDEIAAGGSAADLVAEALSNAERANTDLRDVVHGIIPAALTRGGLPTGLDSLVADFSMPVELSVTDTRLPANLETTAYFIVAEALTNVVKHARATHITVTVDISGDHLDIEVRDDGTGGADPAQGSGLTGLLDRVEASDGTLAIDSPEGTGTSLRARLPINYST